jgi:gluconolactonase
LALDGSGRLVLCQHGDRRLARLERDGSFTVLADRYRGRRLNSPNDVVVTRAGDLLFTDPPFGLARGFEDPARELSFSGVYRLSAGALTLLIDDLDGPNGLAFSPDERTLYVTNAREKRPVLQAYELDRDGRVRGRRVLWDATPWLVRGKGLPDGVKTDRAGRLFVAGPGGLYVLGRDGALLGRVDLGAATANCAWGEDGATLFVTADTALYRLRTRTRGNW